MYVKNNGINVLIKYVALGTNALVEDVNEDVKIKIIINNNSIRASFLCVALMVTSTTNRTIKQLKITLLIPTATFNSNKGTSLIVLSTKPKTGK